MSLGKVLYLPMGRPTHRTSLAVFEDDSQILLDEGCQIKPFFFVHIRRLIKPFNNIHGNWIQVRPFTIQPELWRIRPARAPANSYILRGGHDFLARDEQRGCAKRKIANIAR